MDQQSRDPRNYKNPAFDTSKISSSSIRPNFNRNKLCNDNIEIKNLLTAFLQGQQKSAPSFKLHPKKAPKVANAVNAQQVMAEINDQIAKLEDAQDEQIQTDEDDGTLILYSSCHSSNDSN